MKLVKSVLIVFLAAILLFSGVGLYRTFAPEADAGEELEQLPDENIGDIKVFEIEDDVEKPLPSFVPETRNDSYEAVCMSDLNVRNAYGDYVETISTGTIVTVLSRFNDERLEIEYDGGKTGNVLNRLLPTKSVVISMCELNLRDQLGDVMRLLPWGQVMITVPGHCAPEGRTWVRLDSGEEGSVLSESIQTSFVLIDRRSQFVAMYVDGNYLVGGPCVTGRVTTNRETPAGVFYLMEKATDVWLSGKDWNAHVTYWLPFCAEGRIGMHDADEWRVNYGGEYYYDGGSHGCVNMPFDLTETIFNNIWVGFPIIVR